MSYRSLLWVLWLLRHTSICSGNHPNSSFCSQVWLAHTFDSLTAKPYVLAQNRDHFWNELDEIFHMSYRSPMWVLWLLRHTSICSGNRPNSLFCAHVWLAHSRTVRTSSKPRPFLKRARWDLSDELSFTSVGAVVTEPRLDISGNWPNY